MTVNKRLRFEDERRELQEVLAADPALRNVQVEMFTGDGSAYLDGQILKPADLDRLRSSLEKSYWKPRMEMMVRLLHSGP
jgi:hypothetical protein